MQSSLTRKEKDCYQIISLYYLLYFFYCWTVWVKIIENEYYWAFKRLVSCILWGFTGRAVKSSLVLNWNFNKFLFCCCCCCASWHFFSTWNHDFFKNLFPFSIFNLFWSCEYSALATGVGFLYVKGRTRLATACNVMEKIINGVFTFYAFPVPWGFSICSFITHLKVPIKTCSDVEGLYFIAGLGSTIIFDEDFIRSVPCMYIFPVFKPQTPTRTMVCKCILQVK